MLLIAGGGTAGHVLPGLAVAQELVARGHPPDSIHFVGSARGIDRDLVPAAGFGLTTLPGRGIQRRLALANIAAIWGIVRAVVQAVGLVRRRRPRAVLTVGGFASVACALAAVVWRVPLVVAEQNARAGAANRLVGRFARVCAVQFPGTDLPRTVVTGNPVRADLLAIDRHRDRDRSRQALGLPADRVVVGVFSGSLGSRRINDAIRGAAERWADRDDLAIHHVVGTRDWSEFEGFSRGEPASGLVYHVVRYEQHMDDLLAAADLCVCRSGGTTVAELAAVGVPAVLVPLPIATRDHQTANGRELAEAGAAVVIPDDEVDTARIMAEVDELVGEPSRLEAMATAARSLGRRDAAARLADLVEGYIGVG